MKNPRGRGAVDAAPCGVPGAARARSFGGLPALTVLVAASALLGACVGGTDEGVVDWHDEEAPPAVAGPDTLFQVPPPPFKEEGIFPCTDCHDPELPVNTERRELTLAHEDIVLRHDEEHRWCLACHDAENRDMLHLAGGQKIPFEESYKLCGQCHGDKYRDWRAGVHGRRTGNWNGKKSYLLCVHCHDSHAPAFHPLKPLPPPPQPRRTP